MSTVQSTLDYLYGLQKFGMKLGLHNTRVLLRRAGNPHEKFRTVHIAGTNGKGSTCSMIAAVLTAAGYKVGLYTSPHLVHFNERIRVNGRMISDRDLIRYTRKFRDDINELNATFFEATTAIAFAYFADQGVDLGVIETGLGGRLDATNIVVPTVSVITSIGKDHTEQLGNRIRDIAIEKGGIIKRGVVCVSSVQSRVARAVLKKIALRKRAPFIDANVVSSSTFMAQKGSSQICSLKTIENMYPDLEIPLLGDHQLRNAQTAIAALDVLRKKGVEISVRAVFDGFRNLQALTGIRGRFEVLRKNPTVVLDVGHNPDGIASLVAAVKGSRFRKCLLVFGVMKDKDYRAMTGLLSSLKPVVFAVRPDVERALAPTSITVAFRRFRCEAHSYSSVSNGLHAALRRLTPNDLLLICGSHYVCGEALRAIGGGVRGKSS